MWEADTEKHKAASKCYRPHKSTVSDRLYATANVEIAAAGLTGLWEMEQSAMMPGRAMNDALH